MKNSILSIISNLLFGFSFFFIGFTNTFWGNDPFFGLAIILLSMIFFYPTANSILEKMSGKQVLILKLVIGFLILWASLGVGELFDKIELMRASFPDPNH